jgi:hypothetical protein
MVNCGLFAPRASWSSISTAAPQPEFASRLDQIDVPVPAACVQTAAARP